jgi:hypothetical protein
LADCAKPSSHQPTPAAPDAAPDAEAHAAEVADEEVAEAAAAVVDVEADVEDVGDELKFKVSGLKLGGRVRSSRFKVAKSR